MKTNISALKQLQETDAEQLKVAILKACEEDKALAQHIVTYLLPANTKADIQQYENNVIKEVKQIIKQAGDKYGFINYRASYAFSENMINLIDRVIENAPTTETTIHLLLQIVEILDNVTIDDSNGALGAIIGMITCYFEDLQEDNHPEDMNTLFEQCMNYLKHYNKHQEYFADEIESVIFNFTDEQYLSRLLAYVEERIAESKTKRSGLMWERQYQANKYVTLYLQLQEKAGVSENDLLSYAKPYMDMDAVQQFFVDKYIKEQRLDEACQLLEKSINDKSPYLRQKQLMDLYKQTRQQDKYIQLLWSMLTAHFNIELYKELKEQYATTEWEKVREQLFAAYKDDVYTLAEIFYREGLKDRLAKVIFGVKYNALHLLDKYAATLPQQYLPQILAAYEREFLHLMAQADKRQDYETLTQAMVVVHRFEGGRELTNRLTQHWLAQYNRRPALCEILRTFRAKHGL